MSPQAMAVRAAGETHAAARAALVMLDQCGALLEGLSDEAYIRPSRAMMGSTVGQHVRHALDHFAAAFSALDGGVIDYDHRERGTPVETSRLAARESIADLRERAMRVGEIEAARPATVRVMLTARGDEADLASTLGRELAFAAHHAVHHHAMIAAIALEAGARVPEGFGLAPSTLHYERTRC